MPLTCMGVREDSSAKGHMVTADWNMICSIVTAIAAIVALGISAVQMWVSNKQLLLDRRLRLWIKARGLMELCANNRSSLKERKNGPEFVNDLEFQWMTNNSWLYDIGPSVGHVLEQDWQPKLLTKLEELKEMAFEAKLVFRGHPAEVLSVFIENYASLLMSMYRYQIMLKNLYENSGQFHHDLDKTISAVGEEGQRFKLYEAKDRLLDSFDELTPRMVEKIVSQCRLTPLS